MVQVHELGRLLRRRPAARACGMVRDTSRTAARLYFAIAVAITSCRSRSGTRYRRGRRRRRRRRSRHHRRHRSRQVDATQPPTPTRRQPGSQQQQPSQQQPLPGRPILARVDRSRRFAPAPLLRSIPRWSRRREAKTLSRARCRVGRRRRTRAGGRGPAAHTAGHST